MLFALHLPDHTLSTETIFVTTLLGLAAATALVCGRFRTVVQPSLARFAAAAALAFAVQTVNFPLGDGATSGHLLGSAIAVVLLGPLGGCAAMTLVLLLQAVLLGDGGLTVLGANVLNMAIVSPTVAYGIYATLRRRSFGTVENLGAAFVAGWAASVSAAALCAVELAVSGLGNFGHLAATLVGHHAWLGLIEGTATAALVAAMLQPSAVIGKLRLAPVWAAAAIALALLPFSSELPDTLEAVLESTTNVAE